MHGVTAHAAKGFNHEVHGVSAHAAKGFNHGGHGGARGVGTRRAAIEDFEDRALRSVHRIRRYKRVWRIKNEAYL